MYRLLAVLLVLAVSFLQLPAATNDATIFPEIADSTGNRSESRMKDPFIGRLHKLLLDEYHNWSMPRIRERDSIVTGTMKRYWKVVGFRPGSVEIRDSAWQERFPWSAAFISWAIYRAGAGTHFKYSARHAEYIVWARENARKGKSYFRAYDIKDARAAWPAPGDLVCKNREGKKHTLATIRSYDIAHSDIVVETDPVNRTITTIGGNINNTVHKRVIKLDENGFVDPMECWTIPGEYAAPFTGGQQDYFAVIRVLPGLPLKASNH